MTPVKACCFNLALHYIGSEISQCKMLLTRSQLDWRQINRTKKSKSFWCHRCCFRCSFACHFYRWQEIGEVGKVGTCNRPTRWSSPQVNHVAVFVNQFKYHSYLNELESRSQSSTAFLTYESFRGLWINALLENCRRDDQLLLLCLQCRTIDGIILD